MPVVDAPTGCAGCDNKLDPATAIRAARRRTARPPAAAAGPRRRASGPAAAAAARCARPDSEKVTFAADAFFDFDKYALKPEGMAKLDDLVSKMKGMNLEVIIAVGHTDNIGTRVQPEAVERRANAVKDYLVSKGIEKNRIYTEGRREATRRRQRHA